MTYLPCHTEYHLDSIRHVNSLGPSYVIWYRRSWSTLFQQVMACSMTALWAPSHYLNQCRLIISKVQWHSSDGNSMTRDTSATKISLRITYLKFISNLPGANMLNSHVHNCLAFIQTWKVFCTLTLSPTQCYCQSSNNTRCTKSQNLNISRLALQLFLPNLLKPGVKLRMKM